jgi:hypothetical protein
MQMPLGDFGTLPKVHDDFLDLCARHQSTFSVTLCDKEQSFVSVLLNLAKMPSAHIETRLIGHVDNLW